MCSKDRCNKVLNKALSVISKNSYAGYDPYDGLNSWLASIPLLRRSKWYRIAVTQFFRRLPFNFRPLAGIEKAVNQKSLGLVLLADSEMVGQLLNSEERERVYRLLEEKAVKKDDLTGWGYPFDWQSRTFFLPRNTPTVVVTSFIGLGLLQQLKLDVVPDWFPAERYLSEIANFIRSLNRYEDSRGICLSYSLCDTSRIYNASLLGASYLSNFGAYSVDDADSKLIDGIVSLALSAQDSSGAWKYGEDSNQGWVDHFHTGFVLDSLHRINQNKEDEKTEKALRAGTEFYIDNFFENGRIPKMYPGKLYPVDIHSCAQALITLAWVIKATNEKKDRKRISDLIKKVLSWTLDNMWDMDKNYFYHRKYKFFTNKINYLRWNQAWMIYGLVSVLKIVREKEITL
jgi:hypothetical protein